MFFLQRIGSTLFEPMKSAVNYVETLNYFNSAFKQVAENANTDEWRKSGITFAQMASSMGDTSETALKLSNALTMVGADLASVRNMDFEDVWQDMASGLTGMSRAMDKYGINIRNANMQQELYNLGIDTSISKLSQADKTILRTIILLNNSQYAWGDLAKTIDDGFCELSLVA